MEKPEVEVETDLGVIKKQELLKREIIDRNYNKESFLDFCTSRKENGDDLINWTIEELTDIINQFKQTAEPENKLQTDTGHKHSPITISKTDEINAEVEKIKIYKSQNEEKYLEREIMCRRIEKSVLNDKGITIVIKNPKIVEGGFLSSKYITYEVLTNPLNWCVKRRYSDFEWLRNMLIKFFPGHIIPPLPSKKVGSRRFESDFIEKRKIFLQKFLNRICESEFFKSCESLIAFLQCTDRVMYDTKMKEYSSYQVTGYVEDIKTFEGKLRIVDDEENEKYFTNISNYFTVQSQLFERINFSFKNFYVNLNNACVNLEEIEKDFSTLHNLNSRVLMKEEVNKCYEELNGFFKNWKRILVHQNDIVKYNIKDFFKYIKMENYSYMELIKAREEVKAKYNSDLLKLNLKKEKLWTQMDITKWDMNEDGEKIEKANLTRDKNYAFKKMCAKETVNVTNLHKKLGYANKMNMDELRRLISSYCSRYGKTMKEFGEAFYPTLTDVYFYFHLIRQLMCGLSLLQILRFINL